MADVTKKQNEGQEQQRNLQRSSKYLEIKNDKFGKKKRILVICFIRLRNMDYKQECGGETSIYRAMV